MNNKNNLGQYFTKNKVLQKKVYQFILNKPKIILEPSIGRGDLINYIFKNNDEILFDMFEIDKSIKLLKCINYKDVNYGDFLEKEINKSYKTIIGNPPYIKQKKRNIYIDFIEKCYNLLCNKGELIFIVPSEFLKLTSTSKLLNDMLKNGSFTHIFHPNDEKLFEKASIDIIIFRYCKDKKLEKKVLYNDKLLHIINSDGLITFSENKNKDKLLFKDCFDIYVGIVSGKESVYKNSEIGNIEVLNGYNKIDKYIFIKEYPSNNKKINEYLLKNKDELIKRKIRKFNNNNWFEWGAPRNIKTIEKFKDDECIYIYNLTRNNNIAFKGKINYFGGNLIMLKPKENYDLDKIISYLNSEKFKNNFMFSNRFKIGHRQISNSYIPKDII